MSKLTIRLERWGRTIVYQVLSQDESLRDNCNFKASNGISIISQYYPELNREAIYIRGWDNSYDEDIEMCHFESESSAEEFRLKALEAVEEFNWAKVPIVTK